MSKSFSQAIKDSSTFIVAEIAQAHDGSLAAAHEYIDLVSKSGVDAVKFQTHIASAESTSREPWRVKMATTDKSRYEYWKRMEFTRDEWIELRDHCLNIGLGFLSSPFSVAAVELLNQLDVEVWKIASGEVGNTPMIEAMLLTQKPIILSTGLSTLSEIDSLVNLIRSRGVDLTILQCTSEYPCPAKMTGLNLLKDFTERWNCRVGISDHSGTIFPSIASVALGATVIEVHVTSSRDAGGVDGPSSVTPDELVQLVRGVRFIESAMANRLDKTILSESAANMKQIFGRSIVASRDLVVGHVLTRDDLAFKKPGGGLSWDQLDLILGKKLSKSVLMDDPVFSDLVDGGKR
jgi:N,N'-diacetyllegionaminate synthase